MFTSNRVIRRYPTRTEGRHVEVVAISGCSSLGGSSTFFLLLIRVNYAISERYYAIRARLYDKLS